MNRFLLLPSLAVLAVLGIGCAQPSARPFTPPPVAALAPPSLDAEKALDFPGLHNVVAYAPGLFSGSVPEGKAGFDTLQGLGIRTIISVDGAVPDIEAAAAHGMRYVHLPIGYDGMGPERTLEIAKAAKDLPGPVFIHCHHGKHRSAAATASAAVTLGLANNEQATARMKVSGTAPNYMGLYECVAVAKPVSEQTLSALPANFPEVSTPAGLVQTMLAIDEANDELKALEKAGWKTPAEHPDLVPVAVAGRLADLLRNAHDDKEVQAHGTEMAEWLLADSKTAESLEDGLVRGDVPTAELSARMKLVQQSCKDCHAKYRDRPASRSL